MSRDYYSLLGVNKNASDSEIKRAYRRLARELHPDVNPSVEAKSRFNEIKAAYEILSDPEKRRIVDIGGDPEDPTGGVSSNFSGLGDVFEAFFGGNTSSSSSRGPIGRVRSGSDSLLKMRLDLKECATGVTKQVTIDTAVLCDLCHGKGSNSNSSAVTCDTCNGRGEVQTVQRSLLGQVMTTRPCPSCGGVGETIPNPCNRCSGDGRIRARREVGIKIPAGVGDGMRVRLASQGEVGPGGGPAGDLYVEVHEKQHDTFIRDGDDLHCTISMPMIDAALGATVIVDAVLDGKIKFNVAPGTQPGATTTIRGHGMPHLKSGVRGDLHAHIDVVVPPKLDNIDIELLHRLKENRKRDKIEVCSSYNSTNSGGLFSRLRETFSSR